MALPECCQFGSQGFVQIASFAFLIGAYLFGHLRIICEGHTNNSGTIVLY